MQMNSCGPVTGVAPTPVLAWSEQRGGLSEGGSGTQEISIRSVGHRIAAIVFGFAIALIGLELGLRAASFTLRWARPMVPAAGGANEIRILCIGESTTAARWPNDAEAELRRQHPELAIRIINRGLVGIRTGEVLERLPQWLDDERPHIAITMLGINDEGNVLVYPRDDPRSRLAERLKTVKLLSLLWRSARGIDAPAPPEPDGPAPGRDSQWSQELFDELHAIYEHRDRKLNAFHFSVVLESEPRFLELDPATPLFHVSFLSDTLLNPVSEEGMARFFRDGLGITDYGAMSRSERYRAIEEWGRAGAPDFDLLRMLTSQQEIHRDDDGQELTLTQAIEDRDIAGPAMLRYAGFLAHRGETQRAREMLHRARSHLPDTYGWSLALAHASFRLGLYEDARTLFKRGLEQRPEGFLRHEEAVTGWLARASAAAGHDDEARELLARVDRFSLEVFKEYTRYNYSRIVDELRRRGITVIAMQYPTLSVEALRKLLSYRDDVFYVENRANFERALRQQPYKAIFYDSFAGSFGHCHDAGNRLIADNVVRVVNEVLALRGEDTLNVEPALHGAAGN